MAKKRARLTIKRILAWADDHYVRTGWWPSWRFVHVKAAPGETWDEIDSCLRHGGRGLPGGSSLDAVLAKHRGLWKRIYHRRLTTKKILAWADAHHKRTGKWPTRKLQEVYDAPGETWKQLDTALMRGARGLPGGSSLTKLLAQRRGVENVRYQPRLTVKKVLQWADAHQKRTGRWPHKESGPVHGTGSETWSAVNAAFTFGLRGLPGGTTLAEQLVKHRGLLLRGYKQPLTTTGILTWADEHKKRTGEWPKESSGPVHGVPGESWNAISQALSKGHRSLPGGTSLAALLFVYRGVPSQPYNRQYTMKDILAWADAHYKVTKTWPNTTSGSVHGVPGENWKKVDHALRNGLRGLPGGSSLAKVLDEYRRHV